MYHGTDPADYTSNLLLYYKFDEVNATTAECSNRAITGTLINMDAGNYLDSTVRGWTTDEDTSLSGYLIGTDVEGSAALTYEIVSAGSKGTAAVIPGTNQFAYTPTLNANGTDAFSYKVKDSSGVYSNTQTVSIAVAAVNDAPTASGCAFVTDEDTAITAGSLTAYASDVEGDTLTYSKASDPSHGLVTINADGSFTYTPAENYNGKRQLHLER
jgi:hypothetical protein